jgi:tRNA(Ile2) C34 agmatinyltransferase TiaS
MGNVGKNVHARRVNMRIDEYLEAEIIEGCEPCPMCNGLGHRMGALGNLMWYRCQNCGWDFHVEIDSDEQNSSDYWDFA